MKVPFLQILNVSKKFGNHVALEHVNLTIEKGELFSLLGGSGCGKTTLLRILAGFEKPDTGQILLEGEDITYMPPYVRPTNMMFQSYALFPHMSVEENIAFGLKRENLKKSEIAPRVEDMLALVQMQAYAKRKPHQLSGGQRQRIALARSLIKKPKLLLLDEPLGALDRKLREQTQQELVALQEELGITFIMVTHDQEEAMTMSWRLAVMNKGKIAQIGTPAEIYESPNSQFVADFIGSVNLIWGEVEGIDQDRIIVLSEETNSRIFIKTPWLDYKKGTEVAVAIRPEKIQLLDNIEGLSENIIHGQIASVAYLGDASVYHINLASGKTIQARIPHMAREKVQKKYKKNEHVILYWHDHSGVLLES